MKRFLSLILSLIMAFAIIPTAMVNVSADNYKEFGDYTYNVLSNGTIELISYEGSASNLTIPSKIDEKKVTVISGYAFDECGSLKTITIPDSVTSISKSGTYFEEPYSLKNINVSNKNKKFSSVKGVLFNKSKTKILRYPPHKTAKTYKIPKSVKTIESFAFYSCQSLKNVKLGKKVKTIKSGAFHSCYSLKSVTIGKKVKTIGWGAFRGCTKLKSIKIPKSVKKIGKEAFGYYDGEGTEKMKNFTIKGYKGTAAEKYANKNGFKFIKI